MGKGNMFVVKSRGPKEKRLEEFIEPLSVKKGGPRSVFYRRWILGHMRS